PFWAESAMTRSLIVKSLERTGSFDEQPDRFQRFQPAPLNQLRQGGSCHSFCDHESAVRAGADRMEIQDRAVANDNSGCRWRPVRRTAFPTSRILSIEDDLGRGRWATGGGVKPNEHRSIERLLASFPKHARRRALHGSTQFDVGKIDSETRLG